MAEHNNTPVALTPSVQGTLDQTAHTTDRIVVLYPPDPEVGGHRADSRLQAIATQLTARGIDCLRVGYGKQPPKQVGGVGYSWATTRYEHVGPGGYSLGGRVAYLTANANACTVLSLVAPALKTLEPTPTATQLGISDRDRQLETPLETLRAQTTECIVVPTGHQLTGQQQAVANAVSAFFDQKVA